MTRTSPVVLLLAAVTILGVLVVSAAPALLFWAYLGPVVATAIAVAVAGALFLGGLGLHRLGQRLR